MTTKHSKLTAPVPAAAAVPWHQVPRVRKIGGGTLGAVAVGFVVWLLFFHPFVSTDDARVSATLVRLAAEGMGGRVLDIKAKEGDTVKEGDVLIELDHRTAQAQLQRAEIHADVTLRELKRIEQLAAQHGVSAKELDTARATAQGAQAELILAQVAVDNTYIKSPVGGVVVQKSTEIGNILEPGQTALSIADVEHAWISANIEETSIGRIKIGQKVKIEVDAGGELRGEISEIGSAAASSFALIPSDNAAGNFTKLVQRIPIKIALEAHSGQNLRAGESVEIKIKVL